MHAEGRPVSYLKDIPNTDLDRYCGKVFIRHFEINDQPRMQFFILLPAFHGNYSLLRPSTDPARYASCIWGAVSDYWRYSNEAAFPPHVLQDCCGEYSYSPNYRVGYSEKRPRNVLVARHTWLRKIVDPVKPNLKFGTDDFLAQLHHRMHNVKSPGICLGADAMPVEVDPMSRTIFSRV